MAECSVLFVCTGNICRSPTAEGVFRHYVAQNGLSKHFLIDSAGTQSYHAGKPPDTRAMSSALLRGVKMDDLRARHVEPKDFEVFDLILAMDRGHYDILKSMAPAKGGAALSLFMDFAPEAGQTDVPDPYYGGGNDFEYALDLVEQGARGLLNHLKQELSYVRT